MYAGIYERRGLSQFDLPYKVEGSSESETVHSLSSFLHSEQSKDRESGRERMYPQYRRKSPDFKEH